MNNKKVSIIDYNMGNLFSVNRACEHIGINSIITSDINVIINSDAVILPGVGAFGDAMENLKRQDLISPLIDFSQSNKPFMGICLGMQLLMQESEEFGINKGLNIIEGVVIKFSNRNNKTKVPQVGWNSICQYYDNTNWKKSPLRNIKNEEYMYFVHSFYTVPKDNKVLLSRTNYDGIEYCSSILKENIFACQFHPEKSAEEGLNIYREWAVMNNLIKEKNI